MEKRFPGGDKSGQYLRSASFDYKNYIDYKNLKTIFILKKQDLSNYKEMIVKDFFEFLYKKAAK